MDLHCQVCGQVINEADWSINNVKQLTTGFAHVQCPNKLLISNLPTSMSIALLNKIFSPYGDIKDTQIISPHFAFIEYIDRESSTTAISAMDGFEIGVNKLRVQLLQEVHDLEQQLAADLNEPETDEQKHAKHVQQQQHNNHNNNNNTDATPGGSDSKYVYNREQLHLLSAREIASFLVPNAKIHRAVYKEWMQLLIQCKQDVIDYIYFSKANDNDCTDVFNYVPIPDYLKKLLVHKRNSLIADKLKNVPRAKQLPSQHIIIVHGYIRRIERTLETRLSIIPSIIISMCFDYYVSIMSLCVYQPRGFLVQFEINNQRRVNLLERTQPEINMLDKMRSCVCIPDLMSSDCPKLNNVLNPRMNYLGVFGRDEHNHHLVVMNKEDSFYARVTGVNQLALDENAEYVYCGKREYGLMTADYNGLWQLKFPEISDQNDYHFEKVVKLWNGFERQPDKFGFLQMCYMKGIDKLFAVQCNVLHHLDGPGRKCAMFDMAKQQWKEISFLKLMPERHARYAMVYDFHSRSNVYLMSARNENVLMAYDLYLDRWMNLSGGQGESELKEQDEFEVVGDMVDSKKKPILWLDDKNTNILYQAVLQRVQQNAGYRASIKSFDLRDDSRRWNECFVDWNDLVFANQDFPAACLFK